MKSLVVMLVLLSAVPAATAQSMSRDWRPEERAIVRDFTRVSAIAASRERVYIVSPSAVLVWNPQFRQWEGSFEPDERGILSGVYAALTDPLDNSLWLARPDGWVHYQPDLRLWDQGVVPEGVLGIAFDEEDPASGLYVRTRREWSLLPRGGAVPVPSAPPRRPVGPTPVNDAIRSSPSLQANAAAILTDSRLGSARYTAAARSADNRGWYLGTSGVGALYLPDGAALPERLSYGLPSNRVGAVFSWPGGVWAATDRTSQTDAALTFVGQDLARFNTLPRASAIGTPFTQVRELAGQGRAVWAATDQGVARLQTADSTLELVDERQGLPDGRVYSIFSRRGRIVIGTAHGLARLGDSLEVERVAPGYNGAVLAVFPAGDTVWAGTPAGLLLSLPDQEGLVRPAGMASPSLHAGVVDLSTLGDTLVALTSDGLMWRDPKTRSWNLGPSLSALLGRLRRFAPEGPGFWIAGDRGVGFARLMTPALRPIREGDLPGPVNDLAVDSEFLWVATDGGLVRFRLEAIRP